MQRDNTSDEVDGAVRAAGAGFPVFAQSALAARGRLLVAMSTALESSRAALVSLAAVETHLGDQRLNNELSRTTWQLRMFAEEIATARHLDITVDPADTEWPAGGRPDLRRMLRPVGPVLVFAAGNFPFAFSVAGTDTASALAAGCPVVLKAHPGHPDLSQLTRQALAPAFDASGFPQTLLTVVYGRDAGVRALEHPGIAAAAFTGSTKGGRALFDIACARAKPIPFYGELGSLNPVFVTAAAATHRRRDILDGLLGSYTLSAGQFCTKPGLVVLPAGLGLEDELAGLAGELPEQHLLSNDIASTYEAAAEVVLSTSGVTTLQPPGSGAVQRPALAVVTAAAFLQESDRLQTECFGPMTLIVTYETRHELLAVAAALDGQLTATLHSEPSDAGLGDLMWQLANIAGRIIHNGWPTGVAVTAAQHHGGPYPASTAPLHTSVGTAAIGRFLRPVTFQNMPAALLPEPLRPTASEDRGTP